ncbi:translesion DNA synthesis-associated protein ImuA [Thalassotalea euphylliae]|uniref:translesion DNA synthesis-associated protein ImuA n=1 Tax=Thalassotalea euphylliae TaxID=1655234 RepID=UPI00362E7C90
MQSLLDTLHNRQWLWQGAIQQQKQHVCRSGYQELDDKIIGGLPETGVIEIRTANGIGELRAILPYLQQRQDKGVIVFIAPPAMIGSEFLHHHQIDTDNILLLTPTPNDALWCAEQCLKSGSCASVMLWHQEFEVFQVRRLNLAAEQGQASLFIYRQSRASYNLPVSLSLSFEADKAGLNVTVNRCKAGKPSQPFSVNMARLWPDFVCLPTANNVVSLSGYQRANANQRVS